MAVKSIIDIEVNDDAFKKFAELFAKYQTTLAKTPGAWGDVGKEVKGVKTAFELAAGALVAQHELSKRVGAETAQTANSAERVALSWHNMARDSKEFVANVGNATKSLIRWTGLTGLISGILGAGGLFGIERMAMGVNAGRYSSQGLGLGYGQQKSFGINFGRVVEPSGFLGAVSSALADPAQRAGLYGLGFNNAQLRGSTADVSVELLKALKKMADNTDPLMYQTMLQARGLSQFASAEDLRRLHAMSGSDFNGMVGGYRRDVGPLGLSTGDQNAWTNFSIQMHRAGEQIENVFVKALVPLAPGLEHLSKSFTEAIAAFLGNPALKKWLDSVDKSLEQFAKYVGTDEFIKKIKDFADGIGYAADKLVGAMRFLHLLPSADTSPSGPTNYGPNATAGLPGGMPFGFGWLQNWITGKHNSFGGVGNPFGGDVSSSAPPSGTMLERGKYLKSQLMNKYGWSEAGASIAVGNAQQESSINPDGPAGDGGTAHGMFQWRKDRFEALKAFAAAQHKPWQDRDVQIAFFDQESRSRIPKWKAQKDLSNAGAIGRIYEGYGDNSTSTRVGNAKNWLNVKITNETGGNVVTSANAAAQ